MGPKTGAEPVQPAKGKTLILLPLLAVLLITLGSPGVDPIVEERCQKLGLMKAPFGCGSGGDCRDTTVDANCRKGNCSMLKSISKCMRSYESDRCRYDMDSITCDLPNDFNEATADEFEQLYDANRINRYKKLPASQKSVTIRTDCKTNQTDLYWYDPRCESLIKCGTVTDAIICMKDYEVFVGDRATAEYPTVPQDLTCMIRIRKIFASNPTCQHLPGELAHCFNLFLTICLFGVSSFFGGAVGAIMGYFRSLEHIPNTRIY